MKNELDNIKRCSTCLHSVMKKKYKNTVPSINTCMNEQSEYYLQDRAASQACDKWEEDIIEDFFTGSFSNLIIKHGKEN